METPHRKGALRRRTRPDWVIRRSCPASRDQSQGLRIPIHQGRRHVRLGKV